LVGTLDWELFRGRFGQGAVELRTVHNVAQALLYVNSLMLGIL